MKFCLGDRVIKSENALKNGVIPRKNFLVKGTIVGFSRDKNCVRVLWDGNKTSTMTLHEDFVERANQWDAVRKEAIS